MEVFLHDASGEDPKLVEVESLTLVRELLVGEEADGSIWIEEVDEAVDLELTFDQAGIRERHHVHRGRCRRVEVVVRFNGELPPHAFSPATTIKHVYRWASGPEGANLSPEQAAKHVLAVPGSDHFLDSGVHVGSLVSNRGCTVVLDLLPRERFEG